MRIVEVRGHLLRARMPAPIRNSAGVIDTREALLVELVTDTGVSGWGETQEDPASAWALIADRLAGELAGVDPRDEPDADAAAVADAATRAEARARSALDLARWDLRGRLLGASIASLLGGARRGAVPAYASGPFLAPDGDPYRDLEPDAARYAASGFRVVKLRAGVAPERDVAAIARLRRVLGHGVGIALDLNGGYSRRQAAELLRLVRGLGLVWVEEPIAADDLDGYRELADIADVPLAAGETVWRLADAEALLATGALGVFQPDLYLCGGISGMRRLAAVAARYGVPLVPHVFGTGVNLLASLQFAAALPEAPAPGPTPRPNADPASGHAALPWLELDRSRNPLRLPAEPALDAAGRVAVPAGPGIGAAIDPGAFAPYLLRSDRVPLAQPTASVLERAVPEREESRVGRGTHFAV